MPKIDLTGQRFGRLVALRDVGRGGSTGRLVLWRCRCDCGSIIVTNSNYLRTKHIKSCGCLFLEGNNLKHGHARKDMLSPTFTTWRSMIQRCHDPNLKAFKYYGGMGITVCKRWLKFENFLADMGPRPTNHSIDRIDPYGDYKPSNCRWATQLQQRHNRR